MKSRRTPRKTTKMYKMDITLNIGTSQYQVKTEEHHTQERDITNSLQKFITLKMKERHTLATAMDSRMERSISKE